MRQIINHLKHNNMKKLFTLMLALVLGFGLKAQTSLTQAVDFTATDIHGTEIHLFDILDSGQAVLIDFFYTTCGPCQNATPKVVQSYTAMGCNMYDVYYMEIDYGAYGDTQASCLNWVNTYGIEYPTIAGPNGGTTIVNQYGIGGFPTVILIMPNRQIVIQDLWPISNAQTIITQLEAHGLQQHDCTPPVTYDPHVTLNINEVTGNSITATFTPNEDCASYYYACASEAEIMGWIASGEDIDAIIQEHGNIGTATLTNTFNDLLPETPYYVAALPIDPEGNYGTPTYEVITTPMVYDETLTFSMDPVNLEWCEMAYITIYNNTAEDATITGITDERNELGFYIGVDYIDWLSVLEYTIPQGGSVELGILCCVTGRSIVPDVVTVTSNLPDAQFVVMMDDSWAVDENTQAINLFPNPANENVTLKGENLGMVRVFNVMGQKVEEFEANGSELRINTTSYENGVYFVKAGEQTLKFVVKH